MLFISPIYFHNTGTYVILWRRGSSVLTAGNLMIVRDSRFRLIDGYNLQIKNVMPQDAGDYVCQISDESNRDQIHTVEILGKWRFGNSEIFISLLKTATYTTDLIVTTLTVNNIVIMIIILIKFNSILYRNQYKNNIMCITCTWEH